MIVKKLITKEKELEILGATLLSIEEVETLLTQEERKYKNWWWLRSPGIGSDHAAFVYDFGFVNTLGYHIDYTFGTVRPTLIIKLNSNFKIGDIFIFNNKKFKIISKEYAFCLEDIKKTYFSKYNNNYEKSNIKKYVDNWFKEAKSCIL